MINKKGKERMSNGDTPFHIQTAYYGQKNQADMGDKLDKELNHIYCRLFPISMYINFVLFL